MTREFRSRRATIKDVAIRADVALGTVSRIINGNATVTPELRDHVLKVIEELDYRPNTTARTLRTKRTQAVGIIVTDIRQPIAAEMIAAAGKVVRERGFAPIVGDFHNDRESERLLLRFMAERSVDGLLITISSDENASLIAELKKLGVPVVLWERDAAGVFPSVRSDHRLGTRQAGVHLHKAGRRRVLLVAGHENSWTGREQIAGMGEGLGPDVELKIVHTDHFVPEALARTLSAPGGPDAVVANVHDIPTIMMVIQASKLSCPYDVAVVSIGDDPFLEICHPTITAIRTRPDLIGQTAAQLLLAQIDPKQSAEQPQQPPLITPEFLQRGSS